MVTVTGGDLWTWKEPKLESGEQSRHFLNICRPQVRPSFWGSGSSFVKWDIENLGELTACQEPFAPALWVRSPGAGGRPRDTSRPCPHPTAGKWPRPDQNPNLRAHSILCAHPPLAKAEVGSGLLQTQAGGPGPGFWEGLEGRLYSLSAPGSAIGWEK